MNALTPYPTPANEFARTKAVGAVQPSDGSHDAIFDHVTEVVRSVFGTPVALVTMIDSEESHFLAHPGTEIDCVPKSMSLCAHALVSKKPVVISDTQADPKWRDQPVVVNPPHVRFYAGAPIILSNGFALGTVCAIDLQPMAEPDDAKINVLTNLADLIASTYEMRLASDADKRQQQLDHAQKEAQDEFLTLISHELRTPLNGIAGISACFSPEMAPKQELVDALSNSAQHLTNVVENILTFTELSSGDMGLDEQTINLDQLLIATAVAFGPQAESAGKTIEVAADSIAVLADPAKVGTMISCLLSNALYHGGEATKCSLATSPGGHILLEVSDNGAGIDLNRIDLIFEAFVVGKSIESRLNDGLGLGFPLTKKMAELHGGMLDIVNENDRFSAKIILPNWRAKIE